MESPEPLPLRRRPLTLRQKLSVWAARIGASDDFRSLVVFEIAFYIAYRYGMGFPSNYPAPFWFPDSVLLCTLLIRPQTTWWMYIVAQLPVRFFVAVPLDAPSSFLFVSFVNDSLKALLSASLLRRGSYVGEWFSSLCGFAKYLLVAVVLSPSLSAFGGAAFRVPLGSEFWTAWKQWFLGDALANLLLTPALFCLLQDFPRIRRTKFIRHVEVLLVVTGLGFGAYFAFNLEPNRFGASAFLLYLPVPFLLWAAVRFGPLGTSASFSVISVLATYAALVGRGPFASSSSESAVFSIQLFLLVPSIPFLLLSVLKQQQSKTDSALRESERRFRSLVDTAPVMVWMSDIDGLCTFFNKPWVEFTGVPSERQLGNGWADGVHAEDRELCVEKYLFALHARMNFTMEYRLRRYDAVYRWILDTGIPRYGLDGNFLGYLGSCVDITDRKEAEEELRRLPRELMSAQETERQRIGQELHDDLGQRIVALSIGISHLSHQIEGNENLRTSFANLHQQACDIVMDITQLSHQLRPITLERLGLHAALVSLCESSRDPNGVKVVYTHHGQLPQVVPWNSSIALYRVAQEALRNALTHSGSDQINIDLTASGAGLLVTVTDKGCGFAVESKKIGLGLSGMAERMKYVGGTLSITSTPGAGTTVTAFVPLEEYARPAAASQSA